MGKVIAVAGKGGSGKTALVALMVKSLCQRGLNMLVVDADPAASLPLALGVEVGKTIGGIREEIISDPRAKKAIMERHIRDVVSEIVVNSRKEFSLLVMGRAEGPGCFCTVNDLLRYGIESLSKRYDLTLIDGEGGLEQLNRRVIQDIDYLLIITDPSHRGLHSAALLNTMASESRKGNRPEIGLVINRVRSAGEIPLEGIQDMRIAAVVPEDEELSALDREGNPLLDIPVTSKAFRAVQELVTTALL